MNQRRAIALQARCDEWNAAHPVGAEVTLLHDNGKRLQTRTRYFARGVRLEAMHQRERWGDAHDRSKSAENWYWVVGYLAGKALRASIQGDREKALHHTISAAACLAHWHQAIKEDLSGAGVGFDLDLKAKP